MLALDAQYCKHDILIKTCSWCLGMADLPTPPAQKRVCGRCGDPIRPNDKGVTELIDSRWKTVGECCAF